MHGLTVYAKEGPPFPRDLLLETLQILNCVFDWLYFTHYLTSFSSSEHLLRLCARLLILLHLTEIRISGSNHLLMFLSVETLTSIIRTALPILVDLIDLANSDDITQMVNFPTWIPDCDFHSLALQGLFISSGASMFYNGLVVCFGPTQCHNSLIPFFTPKHTFFTSNNALLTPSPKRIVFILFINKNLLKMIIQGNNLHIFL